MNMADITAFLTYLQSEQSAQRFLKKAYTKLEMVDADQCSYQNCYAFIYYLKHGQHFIKAGQSTTIELKPMLFFYGLVHLLKASLLIKRPNYPETTKLLAHGVSSRKRKKKDYSFMNDEVKIQVHGLFPYFSEHLYSVKTYKSSPDTIKMSLLLSLIPEMTPLFSLNKENNLIHVGILGKKKLVFPKHLNDDYYLTESAFIKRVSKQLNHIKQIENTTKNLTIRLNEPLQTSFVPFLFNFSNQQIYFPSSRDIFLPFSEVMMHYLVLYNLSMVSRYETEWWGDLLSNRSDIDFSYISYYLEHVSDKGLQLLVQELYHDYLTLDNV